MAKTAAWTVKLLVTEGDVTMTNSQITKTQTRESTLTTIHHTIQPVDTSREALDIGSIDITNASGKEYGFIVYNRDTTNFVTVEVKIGSSTYWPLTKMMPGEPYAVPRAPKLDSSGYGGYYLTADTASCDCEVVATSLGDPDA